MADNAINDHEFPCYQCRQVLQMPVDGFEPYRDLIEHNRLLDELHDRLDRAQADVEQQPLAANLLQQGMLKVSKVDLWIC